MGIPVFRGSEFDTFATCHHKFACDLLRRCPYKQKAKQREWLADYCCPEGVAYILKSCSRKPHPVLNRVTEIGSRFHQFAQAYGSHLRREGKVSDWQRAVSIAWRFMGRRS